MLEANQLYMARTRSGANGSLRSLLDKDNIDEAESCSQIL